MRLASLFVGLLVLRAPIYAERHALLIGIGRYPQLPSFNLEAPPNDVAALRRSLIQNWHFAEANVAVLLDGNATKLGILRALDNLIERVRPGDQVFVYYSGHGTSPYDPRNPALGLPLDTGALVPADARRGPAQQVSRQLIIGSVDLRPRFLQLDRKAETFVAFDSCYSGESVKSLADEWLRARDVPLLSLVARGENISDDYDAAYTSVKLPAVKAADFPYERLVFLAAAAKSEKAFEIKSEALRSVVCRAKRTPITTGG
jgi:uncharacterized caspase-like protein